MLTVKCPLLVLGTSGGNIVTHAYWRKCNTVMWHKKYQSDITAHLAILWNCWVTNNCTVSSSVWLQTRRPGFSPWHSERTFPLALVSTPALPPTQSPIQQEPGVERGQGVTLTTHPHLMPRSRMNPSPLVFCVEVSGQLYFTFAKSITVCVSAVNNKVCVVVMLQMQVMYIIFQ
jgi:hypothetical protein